MKEDNKRRRLGAECGPVTPGHYGMNANDSDGQVPAKPTSPSSFPAFSSPNFARSFLTL
jgi:hypothetical protein